MNATAAKAATILRIMNPSNSKKNGRDLPYLAAIDDAAASEPAMNNPG
jgi:hypothetical protein